MAKNAAGGSGVKRTAGQPIPPSAAPQQGGSGGSGGAQHIPSYRDTSAEYVAVKRADLRDITELGLLQEGAGASGMFFFGGAFWLAAQVVVEHGHELQNFVLPLGTCGLSMLFGGVLMWIAHKHFKMKRDRLKDYFETDIQAH